MEISKMSNREKASKVLELLAENDFIVENLMNNYFSGDEAIKFAEFIAKEMGESDSIDELLNNYVG